MSRPGRRYIEPETVEPVYDSIFKSPAMIPIILIVGGLIGILIPTDWWLMLFH